MQPDDRSPVQLLHRAERTDQHDRHSNRHHGDPRRLGPAHPPALANRVLVRRKRIRREGTALTSQEPALERRALAFRPSAPHRRPAAKLRRAESKPKLAERAGNARRRKFARRGGRGHPVPSSVIGLGPRHERYVRNRKMPKTAVTGRDGGNKTLTMAHHHKQRARDQRRPVLGYPMRRLGFEKVKHYSQTDPTVDEIPSRPVTVHRVDVPTSR